MKRILSLMLLVMSMVVFTSCDKKSKSEEKVEVKTESKEVVKTESEEAVRSLVDGVYIGKGNGHNGPMNVETTIKDGKITSIEIVSHYESEGVLSVLNVVPERIIENQTVGVDTVAGATYSGRAVINAVKSSLGSAKANMQEWEKKVATVEEKQNEYEADVIVIGGGGSGLTAAVTAHQQGAKVIIVEKLGFAGGSTIFSAGAINGADPERSKQTKMTDSNVSAINILLDREPHDDYEKALQILIRGQLDEHLANGHTWLFDSPELHILQTYNGGDYKGTPELISLLGKEALESIEFLESVGGRFQEKLGTATGSIWQRSHYSERDEFKNGQVLVKPYLEYIKNNDGIEIHYETKAETLLTADSKITGLKSTYKGKDITYKANKAVIVATGGFGANVEMREKYNTQWDNLGKNIGSSNQSVAAQGDGIKMGEQVGAKLVDMGMIQLHPNGEPFTGMMMGQPHSSGLNRIFVNNEGNRFVAEDARRDTLVNSIYAQPEGTMWIVADGNRYPEGSNQVLENAVELKKTLKANTIEELAGLMKVDVDNLKNSIEEYNKGVDGEPDRLGLKTFDKKLGVAPFYAAKRLPTVHHTMGGLKIDTKGRVLNNNDEVIEGLFAAGEVTGGIHGENRLGGNALIDVLVFGRIAGKNAVVKE